MTCGRLSLVNIRLTVIPVVGRARQMVASVALLVVVLAKAEAPLVTPLFLMRADRYRIIGPDGRRNGTRRSGVVRRPCEASNVLALTVVG